MAETQKEINLIQCEKMIKQIRDVLSVNIVLSEQKKIEEIHVLAEDTRNAKQIVRDIETLLRVEYGIDLDHKKISVVQLQKEQLTTGKRLKFTGMSYSLKKNQLEVTVELTGGNRTCQGHSSGINTKRNSLRLFAKASIEAINQFLEPHNLITLEDVAQFTLGNQDVISTTLIFCRGLSEEILVGSALVRQDDKDAVVRATLAAVNRRVPMEI
ncbi:MAG: hypothetical protein GX922_07800 [Firmicutes bacterium]|nr:hypothetical protein [Bacillota bacterium]